MKDHIRVSKEILARLPKPVQKSDEHIRKPETKIPDHKGPEKEPVEEDRE